MAIQAGDVVQLKSGGPKMVVKFVDEEGRPFCVWLEGKDNKFSSFLPYSLQIVE